VLRDPPDVVPVIAQAVTLGKKAAMISSAKAKVALRELRRDGARLNKDLLWGANIPRDNPPPFTAAPQSGKLGALPPRRDPRSQKALRPGASTVRLIASVVCF
jgi:hypothetical protein